MQDGAGPRVIRRRYAICMQCPFLGWFSRVFSNLPCVPHDKIEATIDRNTLTKRGRSRVLLPTSASGWPEPYRLPAVSPCLPGMAGCGKPLF